MADYHPISLKFDGGIASVGTIHLYEYSRSQYALSRFITVVERYRQTGEVIDRVTADRTVDMVVSAPKRGSFGLEILIPLVQPVASQMQNVAFDALFGYVWRRLLPPSTTNDAMAVELARVELAREKERTKQLGSREEAETERLRIVAEIAAGGHATTQQALALVERALANADPRTLEAGYGPERLIAERHMLSADLTSELELNSYEAQLRAVPSEDLTRLTGKLRPMVSDIALPLRRSATVAAIGTPANDNKFVRLDAERVRRIGDRRVDPRPIEVAGLVRSYDRFSRRGKIESDAFEKTMYFSVDFDDAELPPKVISAMRRQKVVCVCNAYRDAADNITSFILRDILD